jgi:hypothetical protein
MKDGNVYQDVERAAMWMCHEVVYNYDYLSQDYRGQVPRCHASFHYY